MIGIYNTITIDNMEMLRPSGLTLEREDIYAGEYTTCTGAKRADRIGWKYSDIELSWDTLPNDMLNKLTGLTEPVDLTFTDSDGSHTETVIRQAFTNVPTRSTMPDGTAIWKNVKVKFSFVDSHQVVTT